MAESKVDEFRAIVRALSLEQCSSISAVLHQALDSRSVMDTTTKKKSVDNKSFCDGLLSVKQIRQKFTPSDLADVFNDVNEGEMQSIVIDDLADFVQKTMGRARAVALKLRTAVMKEYKNEEGFKHIFSTICHPVTQLCERETFTQFAEDFLRTTIKDNDAVGAYSLFDMNGDGKLTLDDFIGFMSGKSTEAATLLVSGNPEAIVDIKISNTPQLESEYLRNDYVQIAPNELQGVKYDLSAQGSFGKGESIWIWRRNQGTCSGRLKPILDIQLTTNGANSSMVVAGYECVRGTIAGMKLWVKRATDAVDEKEALVDLQVSLGSSTNPSDTIWAKPGVDWIRVDANFVKPNMVFAGTDAFLWMLPNQVRNHEVAGIHSLLREASALSAEKRQERIMFMARSAIRANIPTSEMRSVCNPTSPHKFVAAAEANNYNSSGKINSFTVSGKTNPTKQDVSQFSRNMSTTRTGSRGWDFSNLFHSYDQTLDGKMTQNKFYKMMKHSGVWLENTELTATFRLIDLSLNGRLSREEYAKALSLTDFEIDYRVEIMRHKLLNLKEGVPRNPMREARLLSQVFKMVNTDCDGIISLSEFMEMMAALEIYVTEEEARKILKMMDADGDDRVEEGDFVSYVKRASEISVKKAHRLREAANVFRRWLQRGHSAGPDNMKMNSDEQVNQKQWEELQHRHVKARGKVFPGYIDANDVFLHCAYLGTNVSSLGSRELLLMIAPEQNGRVHQTDLTSFMSRSNRSFGELLALLERDVMKPIFDAFSKYKEALRAESSQASHLEQEFSLLVREIVAEVQNTIVPGTQTPRSASNGTDAATGGVLHDVVSVYQLKNGIEASMRRYKEFDGASPTAEEWAGLATLTDSAVAEDEIYGVSVAKFIDGICSIASGGPDIDTTTFVADMDVLVKEIQRLVRAEALEAGNGVKMDYRAAFNVINTDGDDVLSIEEFRAHLVRLQLAYLCPEGELPKLLRLFDSTNKGYITFEDFMAFVNKYKNVLEDDGLVMEDIGDVDEDPANMSDTPPLAITRNADCDYLVWFIWRQCCRIEPAEPEAIVNELEVSCTETELTQAEGSISIKELWNLMFELKIQDNRLSPGTNITKAQYEKGVRYLGLDNRNRMQSQYGGGGEMDHQVDYPTLCRYVIRMGRAHAAMREEKRQENVQKFHMLKSGLRQYLLSAGNDDFSSGYTPRNGDPADAEVQFARTEKVFRRMDSDGDGYLTAFEFKSSLKRLGYKDEKLWNASIVQMFFRDIDTVSDGRVSLLELNRMLRDEGLGYRPSNGNDNVPPPFGSNDFSNETKRSSPSFGAKDRDGLGTEEDDIFFGKGLGFNDSDLYQKMFSVLKEMVPVSSNENPIDAIKTAVRRFFQKSDSENLGQVGEERFRAFLRRSSVQDVLTSGEIRRMMDALRRKATGAGLSNSAVTVIDYEKMISNLEGVSQQGPSSRSDIIFLRLKDAAADSATAGRPFHGLCGLVDTSGSGRLTKEELLLTTKMMGVNITMQDIDSLKDYVGESCFGTDGSVDYRELCRAINQDQPRNGDLFGMGPASFSRNHPSYTGYPQTGTAGHSVYPPPPGQTPFTHTAGGGGLNASYSTPRGPGGFERMMGTPMHSTMPNRNLAGRTPAAMNMGLGGMTPAPEVTHLGMASDGIPPHDERDLQVFSDKVRHVVDERSLLYHLEKEDHSRTGSVSARTLLAVLEGSGIIVTSGDLALVSQYFGRGHEVQYEALLRHVFSHGNMGATGGHTHAGSAGYGTGSAGGAYHQLPSYVTPRTIQRLKELRQEGRDPRDMFEAYDLDRSGLVDVWRFREVLGRLYLLFPGDLDAAAAEFASLSGREMVSYDDFCRVLETANTNGPSYGTDFGGSQTPGGGNGFTTSTPHTQQTNPKLSLSVDAPLASSNVERWLTHEASPKQKREFNNVYDSLKSFKDDQTGNVRDFPVGLDEGSFDRDRDRDSLRGSGFGLPPPRLTDSASFGRMSSSYSRPPLSGMHSGSGRYGSRDSFDRDTDVRRSRDSRADSPKPPQTSPSKVGTKMWGSATSLDYKGVTPKVGANLWCCAVCLYSDNQADADKCVICDSQNYNKNTDFAVKAQCKNCTFLNGQFSGECEMCGEPLRSGNTTSSREVSPRASSSRW